MRHITLALALFLLPYTAWSVPPEATAYQITVDHAGVTRSEGVLALQETPLWTASLPGQSSFPIIAGGRVFVVTGGMPGGSYGTQLHAFDAQTGARLWGPTNISGTYYWSGLAYEAGKLFVVNFDGLLRSYDAATGTPGWSVQLPGYWFSSEPTASNGILYVVGNYGSYAIDQATGDTLWTATSSGMHSSPAVGPNGVYMSDCTRVFDYKLTSSSAAAELNWQYNGTCSGGSIGITPVYANGRVYVRSAGGGSVILDGATGAPVGNFTAGPAPAITSTTGFFLSGGTLRATDLATNTVQWSFAGEGGLAVAPIVVDQTVIVGSTSGTLYGLNTQTGHVTWQVATGASIPGPDEWNVSSPVTGLGIANGVLIVPAGSTLLAYSIFGPPAPTGLNATGRAGAVELNWSGAAGASTYNVYMGASAGSEDVVPVKTGVTGTNTTITNLTPGTTYFFTVKAVGPGGISAASNESSATPHNPDPPSALNATAVTGGVALSWTASSEAISYNIYMGTAAGTESSTPIVSGVTTTGTTVNGLTPGSTYYFVVKAIANGASSGNSNEASATALTAPPPTGLTATAGIGSVTLNWSAASGATSYNVYSATSAGGEGTLPIVSGIVGTSTTLTGLTPDTTYYFVLRSVLSGVPGTVSTETSARVLPTPAPTGLTATGGVGQVALNWTASLTATSYSVYSCSGGAAILVRSTPGATITGLTPEVPYCFVVKAQGPAGLSAASNQASATPLRYPAPTNVVAIAGVGQVTLTWSASAGATQYNVYMGTAAGMEGITPAKTVPGTSAVIGGLTNTHIYYFFIQADTPIGASLPSNEVLAAPLTPPPPTNLSLTPGSGQIALAWSASAGATSYNVYMGTAAAAESSTPVQTGITGLATIITGLNNGTTYYYVVRAETPSGLSFASNEVSGTPAPLPPAPPTPENLTAVASAGQVALSWNATAGATQYQIYMGTSSGGQAATPAATTVGVTATITGLTNGTTYYFNVRASNVGGTSAPSNEASAKPMSPPPAAPTNLAAAAGSGQVTLSWNASVGATSYNLYMGTSAGGTSPTPTQTGIAGLSTTVTGLTNGTTYFYVVRAVNADGTSAASSEASATPVAPASPPAQPSGGGSGGGGGGGAFDVLSLLLLSLVAAVALYSRARARSFAGNARGEPLPKGGGIEAHKLAEARAECDG